MCIRFFILRYIRVGTRSPDTDDIDKLAAEIVANPVSATLEMCFQLSPLSDEVSRSTGLAVPAWITRRSREMYSRIYPAFATCFEPQIPPTQFP